MAICDAEDFGGIGLGIDVVNPAGANAHGGVQLLAPRVNRPLPDFWLSEERTKHDIYG